MEIISTIMMVLVKGILGIIDYSFSET